MEARRTHSTWTWRPTWWVVVLMSTRWSGLEAWDCSASDRATLLEFSSGFVDLGGVFSSWTPGTNCCSWRGVRCRESDGAVLELTVVGDNVGRRAQTYCYGSFEGGECRAGAGLVALAGLEQLTIQAVLFNGPVPSEWGSFSSNLVAIVVNNANLRGDIPSSLASIRSLQTLDLQANQLKGVIPSRFCFQLNIRYIDVSYNDMSYDLVPWCFRRENSRRNVTVLYSNQGNSISISRGAPGALAHSARSIRSIMAGAISFPLFLATLL